VYRAFFRAPQGKTHGEAPLPMVLALLASALATLAFFVFPQVPLALARALPGS